MPDNSNNNVNTQNLLKTKRPSYKSDFYRRDRAIKIIKEMSEFLRLLDLKESDILKTMIVRFAIESVEATQGSLIVYNKEKNELKYQDTFIYDGDNKIVLDPTVFAGYSDLMDVTIKPGEGIIGMSFQSEVPMLIEDLKEEGFPPPAVAEAMNIDVRSIIVIPLKVSDEIFAVLEITRDTKKPPFTNDELETVMIIANFAATILENAKLFMWAIHDSLTGLYNKHYFSNELVEEAKRAKKFNRVFSIAMFDIDNFKRINDSFGHTSGDYALVSLANNIKSVIRQGRDIASRYGGDEFIIVFRDTKAEDAAVIAEKLRAKVAETVVKATDGSTFSFTLSIGLAEFPKDGDELYLLFNHADEAAYVAKKAGKNRVVVYKPEMSQQVAGQKPDLDR